MSININVKELKNLLDSTPHTHNIMLSGKHGIGKSRIITDHFSAKGQKVVTLFLGQMSDPGDLIGLPNKDEKTGKTVFMPPYWFPTDNQPLVLFLDELNRARPEILQTIMDLALNRKLAGRELPAGSRIVSAVNDGEEYQLTDLFSLTAGLLYSQQGCKYDDESTKLDYINVPILANVYVAKGLAVKLGVQPAFKINDNLPDGADIKSFDFSIPVGVSYEYSNFQLDARYNWGMTKVADWADSKNSVFQITLGYKFAL